MGRGLPRAELLAQHEDLRSTGVAVLALAREAAAGDGQAARALPRALAVFGQSFHEHVRDEERALLPPMRQTGAAGRVRADRLCGAHVRQAQELGALVRALTTHGRQRPAAALDVERLLSDLLRDMEEEDRQLLGSEPSDEPSPVALDQGAPHGADASRRG